MNDKDNNNEKVENPENAMTDSIGFDVLPTYTYPR